MKTSSLNILKTGIFSLLALGLAACQTTGGGGAMGGAMGGSAVMCDKCKTVWVQRPSSTGSAGGRANNVAIYRSEKAMQCPECESNVATFFRTGSLKHQCKTCGGAMTHCEAH